MPRYSEERKAATLKKLLPPQSRSVNFVSDGMGAVRKPCLIR